MSTGGSFFVSAEAPFAWDRNPLEASIKQDDRCIAFSMFQHVFNALRRNRYLVPIRALPKEDAGRSIYCLDAELVVLDHWNHLLDFNGRSTLLMSAQARQPFTRTDDVTVIAPNQVQYLQAE